LGDAQGNPWQTSLAWRGYSLSSLQGTEQGLAVYLDGIRFNQPFGDTVALDMIPEAALAGAELREASPIYGRNALGGTLLLTTRNGRDLPGLRVSGEDDSIGGYGGSLSAGWHQGANDALLVAEALHDRGWRDSSPSNLLRLFGEAGHQGDGWGGALRAVGTVSKLAGNGVAPIQLLDADYAAVFTRPDLTRTHYLRISALPWVDLGNGARLEATLHGEWLKRDAENGDLADFGACDADPALLCVGDDSSGFGELLRDTSGAAVPVDPTVDTYAVRNLASERTRGWGAGLQVLKDHDTAVGTLRLAAGADFDAARTEFAANSELASLQPDRWVTGLGPLLHSDEGSITPASLIAHLRDVSLYASAAVPLARRVQLELGVRWSETRLRLEDRLGTALNGTHRFARLNPSAELDYTVSEALRLEAGYAETNRTPTPAEVSCADPAAPCALANFFLADPPLRQVVARHWHLGGQGALGSLTWKLGAWRADSTDEIRHVASEVRGRAYFINGGRSRRQGIEAGLSWHRGPVSASMGYAFTDARFREAFSISSPANPAADAAGVIAVAPGDLIPGVPRHVFKLSGDYQGRGWSLGADLRAQSSQILAGDEGNDNPPAPGFAVVDLRARVSLGPGVELSGEVRNLLDRRYASFATFSQIDGVVLREVPGASDPRAYAPGAPRRASLRLSVKY
ncbi:MAG: TonB-dependent receptor, partial [Proteobacteria bacterium]|nr:TonB-dependent receptor [Pseudomonadota bacterium]